MRKALFVWCGHGESARRSALAVARAAARSRINRYCDFARPRFGAKRLRPCESAQRFLTWLAASPAGSASLRLSNLSYCAQAQYDPHSRFAWCGQGESNSYLLLGKQSFYHLTMPAWGYYITTRTKI